MILVQILDASRTGFVLISADAGSGSGPGSGTVTLTPVQDLIADAGENVLRIT